MAGANLPEEIQPNSSLYAEHNPITKPLMTWLSLSLMNTAKFFVQGSASDIESFSESDKPYYLWSFVNTIFHGTAVRALG
ncbi:hypothetical protein DFQ28_011370, partial [Apophysomyces sp. BC1034]